MVVRGAAAVTAAQASPGGASIGHILNDRMADMRAEMAHIAALTKKGLALSSTDSNARALLAVVRGSPRAAAIGADAPPTCT